MEVPCYADRYGRARLQNRPGVAEVRIYGERRYNMRIWLVRARLAAYRLTPDDVELALRQQNVEVPSGRIEGVDREFTVLSRAGLVTPVEFGRIVLKDDAAEFHGGSAEHTSELQSLMRNSYAVF